MASYISQLRPATPDEALAIKQKAAQTAAPPAVLEAAKKPGLNPGSERWLVKTGADDDVDKVGKVVVDTTVRELGLFTRPDELLPATSAHTELDNTRVGPVETTVWRVTAQVIALKQESDGDFHLVLQDDSGATMVAEVPLPKPEFVDPKSPFFDDIAKSRDAVQQQFQPKFAATAFARAPDGKQQLVPRHALQRSATELTAAALPAIPIDLAAAAAAPAAAELFAMRIDPTPATITGVGFFDKDHGATGAAPNVVELHPVLDITFGV
jgi:hypothetical protein